MPTTVRRKSWSCPTCNLQLTILRAGASPTVEYDVAEWMRLCRHTDRGSPLACPSLEPLVRDWLAEP